MTGVQTCALPILLWTQKVGAEPLAGPSVSLPWSQGQATLTAWIVGQSPAEDCGGWHWTLVPHPPPQGMWPDSCVLVGRRKPRRGPGPQGSAKPPGHQRALTSPRVPVASGALGPPHTSSSTSMVFPGVGAQPLPPAEPRSTRPVPRAAQGLAQTLFLCGCRPHPRCQETADNAWRAQTRLTWQLC